MAYEMKPLSCSPSQLKAYQKNSSSVTMKTITAVRC